MLLLLGLSIGALGFAATGAITDSVESTALEEQEETAIREAKAFDDWNARNENFVVASAGAPVVASGDVNETKAYLEDIYYDLPDERMHALYVDTESGEVVAGVDTTAETLAEIKFPDTNELGDLSTHYVQRTEPYAMPDQLGLAADEHPVVSYYIGVGEDADRALVFTFALSDRTGDYATQTSGDTVVTILDEEGRIVGDNRKLGYGGDEANASFGRQYEGYERFQELAALDGPGAATVEGRPSEALRGAPYEFAPDDYVVGYHTTAEGWSVLVHTSEADALGFVTTVNRFGYLITVIGVGLIGVFGVVVGRNTATSIRTLSSRAAEIREGEYDVDLETERVDEIGDLYRTVDEMRESLVTRIEESERTREQAEKARDRADEAREEAESAKRRAEQTRREAQEQNEYLERKAAEYCDVMGECADGDLTQRLDPAAESEPMAEIATTFNATVDDIERTIARISAFAGDVADASDDVRAECTDLEATNDSVADSVEEITAVTDEQNERMEAIATEIQGMSATIEEIASTADSLADTSRRAARGANEGIATAEDVGEEMERIERRADAALEEMRALEDSMAEIDEIVGVITDIADQTNILALNASIEAAHAGGDGTNGAGFATVAQEVKQLAEETKTSAAEIESLIDTVQAQTDRTVDEMATMRERVIEGAETVEQSVSAFEEIEAEVSAADHGVQEINDATDAIADSTQDLVPMAEDVTALSDRTAREAAAVAESVSDQTAAIATVSRNANDLSERSRTLRDLLDEFAIDRGEIDGTASLESGAGRDETVELEFASGTGTQARDEGTSDLETIGSETKTELETATATDDGESADLEPRDD
uniref:methyl-accepting chemotaxis protein n=1 Tax=Halopiger aswanensis TaxID=148449 RepID=UPI001FE74EA8|nr:HAMP domain-containing methyl-accepting chemotaxis protein [Halopiger aswanensis]